MIFFSENRMTFHANCFWENKENILVYRLPKILLRLLSIKTFNLAEKSVETYILIRKPLTFISQKTC